MLKKLALLLSVIVWMASCKKQEKEKIVPPSEETAQEQPEVAAIISRQYHTGALRWTTQCTDGNIVTITSYPASLVKVSSFDGSLIWVKDLDVIPMGLIKDIAPLPSGGFVVSGNGDYGAVKLAAFDANGNNIWTRSYTDENNRLSNPHMTVVGHNDVVIAAAGVGRLTPYYNSICMLKVSSSGDEISRNFHLTWKPQLNEVISLRDKSILSFLNFTTSSIVDPKGCIVRKFDASGILSDSTFITQTGTEIAIYSIVQTQDGGFICCGTEKTTGTEKVSPVLIRLNSDLDVLDKKIFSLDTLHPTLYRLTNAQHGVIAVGWAYKGNTASYPLAVKLDNAMNVQWQKVYTAVNNIFEELDFVAEVKGRYVAAGTSWNGITTNIGNDNFKLFLMDFSESGKEKE